MQTGKTLPEIAKTVRDLAERRVDYVQPQGAMRMLADSNEMVLDIPSSPAVKVEGNEIFHRGISEKLNVPWKYYQRMRNEAPNLLADNVNCWLDREPRKNRLVRTYVDDVGGGHRVGRAMLSDRYKWRDDAEVFLAAMNPLMDSGFQLFSSNVTETRMHLQCRLPRLEGEVKKGDAVQMGLSLRNSEVGFGCTQVDVLIYRLICLNGMTSVATQPLFREHHIGGLIDTGIYSNETRQLESDAFVGKLTDTIKAATSTERFTEILGRMQDTAKLEIPAPQAVIEGIAPVLGLTKAEQEQAFAAFIDEGDRTQWGLSNAVTRLAHNAESYDRAVELEGFGGRVLTMSASQLERLQR